MIKKASLTYGFICGRQDPKVYIAKLEYIAQPYTPSARGE